MTRESHCFCIIQPWLLATTKKPIDSRITLHAAHTAYKKILIRTVDTDVVVLAVALARTLKEEIKVWVSISTGKAFRIWAAHEIVQTLCPEKAQALKMFDALTDCDTLSCFDGYGQKTAWTVWIALPKLTRHSLFSPLHRIILMKMPLFYDRTCTITDIDEARRKLFAKKSHIHLIPPTCAALEQHSR